MASISIAFLLCSLCEFAYLAIFTPIKSHSVLQSRPVAWKGHARRDRQR